MNTNKFVLAEDTDTELHVSVTRSSFEPPMVNVYATPKAGGDVQFVLTLDLSHVYELIENLTVCCEQIEADMDARSSSQMQ